MNSHIDVCLNAYVYMCMHRIYKCILRIFSVYVAPRMYIRIYIYIHPINPQHIFCLSLTPSVSFFLSFCSNSPLSSLRAVACPQQCVTIFITWKTNQRHYPSGLLLQGCSDLCARSGLVPYQKPKNARYCRLSRIPIHAALMSSKALSGLWRFLCRASLRFLFLGMTNHRPLGLPLTRAEAGPHLGEKKLLG